MKSVYLRKILIMINFQGIFAGIHAPPRPQKSSRLPVPPQKCTEFKCSLPCPEDFTLGPAPSHPDFFFFCPAPPLPKAKRGKSFSKRIGTPTPSDPGIFRGAAQCALPRSIDMLKKAGANRVEMDNCQIF